MSQVWGRVRMTAFAAAIASIPGMFLPPKPGCPPVMIYWGTGCFIVFIIASYKLWEGKLDRCVSCRKPRTFEEQEWGRHPRHKIDPVWGVSLPYSQTMDEEVKG